MKKKSNLFRSSAVLFALTIIVTACGDWFQKDEVKSIPVIQTKDATVDGTSILTGGVISDNGNAEIISKGVCYSSLSTTPTVDGTKIDKGSGSNEFSATISSLEANSTYYIRAYATNSEGTSYGATKSADIASIAPPSNEDEQGNLLIINNSGKSLVLYIYGTRPFRTIPNSSEDFLIQLPNPNRDILDLQIYRFDDVSGDFDYPADDKLYKRWNVVLAEDNNVSTRKTWFITSNTAEKNTGEIEFSYAGGTENSVDVYLNSKTGAKISSMEPGSNYIKTVGIDFGVHTILYRYWYSDNNTTSGEVEVSWVDKEMVNGDEVPIFIILKNEASLKSLRIPHYQGSGTIKDTYGELKVYNYTSKPIEIYAGDLLIEKIIYTDGSSQAASIISANSFNSDPFVLKEGIYVFKAIDIQTTQVVAQKTDTIVADVLKEWKIGVENIVPIVQSYAAESISTTSALLNGEVTSEGSSQVTRRGFCYNAIGNPTLNDNYIDVGTGTGLFSTTLNGLLPNTQYFVKAYATNSAGIAYGEAINFKTLTLVSSPVLFTLAATDITQTTATSGGNITSDGGATVAVRGIVWNTTENPTLESNSGSTSNGTGIGIYPCSLTGLTSNTTYYVKAFATNSAGTAYGDAISFKTIVTATLPSLATLSATDITQTTATSGGNITSDGGATVTVRGIVWNTTENPTLESNSGSTSNGTGIGSYSSSLTGLTSNTTYYVKAYASNNAGTSYGEQKVFTTGNLSIGATYGGGIIAYILQPQDIGYVESEVHGLIVASTDQSTFAEWGCSGTSTGATSIEYGTGLANTTSIVNNCNSSGYAAKLCYDLVLNGYSDWFLPSKEELNKLFLNKDAIGGLTNYWYWSSSEYSSTNSWGQNILNGIFDAGSKGGEVRVRAVRYF